MAAPYKEFPRYKVVATRLNDEEHEDLLDCLHFTKTVQTEYIRQAIAEKNERERANAHAVSEMFNGADS